MVAVPSSSSSLRATVVRPFAQAAAASSSSAPVVDVPANLIIADASIFVKKTDEQVQEAKRLLHGIDQYQFALLPSQVPATAAVAAFADPAKVVGQVALNPTMFALPLRKDIVLNVVRYIRHARRQPKKTKRMSEIRGSNKKPRPQKGQGVGQVGHRRNSAWKGGQKAMGPVLRDYSIDLNKKVRALGTMMTIVAKFREGNLLLVDSLDLPTPKTKDLVGLLRAHGVADHTALVVDFAFPANFALASQNVEALQTADITKFNAFEVLRKQKLVLTARVFEELQAQLLYMYGQGGRRKIQQRAAACYDDAVAQGRAMLAAKQSQQS